MRVLRLLAVLLCLAAARPAGAEDPPPIPSGLAGEALQKEAKRWLADLQAASFTDRERARRGLKRYASQLQDLLESALEDPDPEVRRTCQELLEQAGVLSRTDAANDDDVPVGDFAALSQVTWRIDGMSAADAFARFGEAHGGVFVLPSTHAARKVSVDVDGAPYFTALAELLRAADLEMRHPFDRGGKATLEARVVDQGEPAPPVPWTAVGPIQVRVTEVVTKRLLGTHAPPSFVLKLDIWWAPAVQVNQLSMPRIVKAEDAAGRAYVAPSAASTTYGLGAGTYARTVDVALRPQGTTVGDRLASAELDLRLQMRHDPATVTLDDASTLPADRQWEGVDEDAPEKEGLITFRSLECQPKGSTNWVAEIVAHLSGDLPQQTAQVTLVGADGERHAMHVGGGRTQSADGTLHLTARAWQAGKERPTSLALTWFRRQERGKLRFTLKDVPLK